jgi:hypothetical protein
MVSMIQADIVRQLANKWWILWHRSPWENGLWFCRVFPNNFLASLRNLKKGKNPTVFQYQAHISEFNGIFQRVKLACCESRFMPHVLELRLSEQDWQSKAITIWFLGVRLEVDVSESVYMRHLYEFAAFRRTYISKHKQKTFWQSMIKIDESMCTDIWNMDVRMRRKISRRSSLMPGFWRTYVHVFPNLSKKRGARKSSLFKKLDSYIFFSLIIIDVHDKCPAESKHPSSPSQCLTVPHSTSLSVHRRSNANPNRNFIVDFCFFSMRQWRCAACHWLQVFKSK